MNKALFIVDMVKDFMPRSIYSEAKLPVEPAEGIIEPLKELLKICREQNIPIFYLNDCHKSGDKEFKEWGEHCIQGTEGAEAIEELKPKKGEEVIEKNKYSGFSNPELKRKLKEKRIKEIYLTGVVTHVCILETGKDALKQGFKTKAIKQCISGTKTQEHGLEKLKEAGIQVIDKEKFKKKLL